MRVNGEAAAASAQQTSTVPAQPTQLPESSHQMEAAQEGFQDQQDMETADYATQDYDQRMQDVNQHGEQIEPERQSTEIEPRAPTVLDLLRQRSEHATRRSALNPFRSG